MLLPRIGPQIAPEYECEECSQHSDSDESGSRDASTLKDPNLEKAETQRDNEVITSAGRAKSNRQECPKEPAGFWHWEMVCIQILFNKLGTEQS